MKTKSIFETLAAVIDNRQKRGATDENLIDYLEHLKEVWKENHQVVEFCGLCIETIQDIPQIKGN
jgi:hypothetical protein